jgi:ribosomal protein S18 acetylase RimI-like enzyme
MIDYRTRSAEPGDLPRLLEMNLALQDHLESAGSDSWRMSSQARLSLGGQIAARLAAAGSLALVAEHEQDGVVGMAFGRIVTNSRYVPSRTGFIDQLYILPAHRRRGLGSRLVSEMCGFFVAQGVYDVSLRSMHGNAQATAFWEALGFTPRIVTLGTRLAGG